MRRTSDALTDLTDPAGYRHWTTVTIRFSDEDRLGHINNAVYVTWLEVGRVVYIERFLEDPARLDTVLAHIAVDFLRETHFPGEVQIGGRMLALGERSFRTGWAVFREGQCLATASCVNVFFDPVARRSASPSATIRAALEAELASTMRT